MTWSQNLTWSLQACQIRLRSAAKAAVLDPVRIKIGPKPLIHLSLRNLSSVLMKYLIFPLTAIVRRVRLVDQALRATDQISSQRRLIAEQIAQTLVPTGGLIFLVVSVGKPPMHDPFAAAGLRSVLKRIVLDRISLAEDQMEDLMQVAAGEIKAHPGDGVELIHDVEIDIGR